MHSYIVLYDSVERNHSVLYIIVHDVYISIPSASFMISSCFLSTSVSHTAETGHTSSVGSLTGTKHGVVDFFRGTPAISDC